MWYELGCISSNNIRFVYKDGYHATNGSSLTLHRLQIAEHPSKLDPRILLTGPEPEIASHRSVALPQMPDSKIF